jgi:hypothetical protein
MLYYVYNYNKLSYAMNKENLDYDSDDSALPDCLSDDSCSTDPFDEKDPQDIADQYNLGAIPKLIQIKNKADYEKQLIILSKLYVRITTRYYDFDYLRKHIACSIINLQKHCTENNYT